MESRSPRVVELHLLPGREIPTGLVVGDKNVGQNKDFPPFPPSPWGQTCVSRPSALHTPSQYNLTKPKLTTCCLILPFRPYLRAEFVQVCTSNSIRYCVYNSLFGCFSGLYEYTYIRFHIDHQ